MMSNTHLAIALAALITGIASVSWLIARRITKIRSVAAAPASDDLEILAGQVADLVDLARFANNGFHDDNYYSIRSKYCVIAKILRTHPVYSRYVDEIPSVAATTEQALPLSLLQPEAKEYLLVSVRELQGAVQILIDLRNAGCIPATTADRTRTGGEPVPTAAHGRGRLRTGYRLAAGAAVLASLGLLAGTMLRLPSVAPPDVATLTTFAERGVQTAAEILGSVGAAAAEKGLGRSPGDAGRADQDDPATSRDTVARSQRLAAEIDKLGQAVARQQGEVDALDAAIGRLRRIAEAASVDEDLPARLRRSAEAARRAADEAEESRRAAATAASGAAEMRAGLEGAAGDAAASRARAAEQREALAAVGTELDAARAGLGALREILSEETGKAERLRSENEAGIRQVRDGLASLGDHVAALDKTMHDNRAALDRIAGSVDSMTETARAIDEVRDEVSRARRHLADIDADGSEATRSLSALKVRLAALGDSLAGTTVIGTPAAVQATLASGNAVPAPGEATPASAKATPVPAKPAPAPAKPAPAPSRTEAALQPEDWRRAQQALSGEGYYTGKIDGSPGASTRAAITRYQRGLREEATGRLSPSQIDRLIPRRPSGPMANR